VYPAGQSQTHAVPHTEPAIESATASQVDG
jgi:hypothetical protein